LFLILGLILAFFILFIPREGHSASLSLMTPQETIRRNNDAVTVTIVYFVLVFLNAIFFLLAKFNLKNPTQKSEEIVINSPVITFFEINQKFWGLIFIFGLICSYITYPYLGFFRVFLILLSSLISLWIYLNKQNSYLKLADLSGKKIDNLKVKILNHKDEKLVETRTDQFGKIKMIASKGFYKIFISGRTPRTFHVKENREIVNLKLKI